MVISQPGKAIDYTLLGFASAATVLFIIANAVIFAHRERSYFRAQGGVYLILGSSVAGLIWLAATFVSNGHFPTVGPLRSCVLWVVWMQGIGVFFWFMLTVLRLRRMYELSHGIQKWSWRYYVFIAVCLLPILVFSTVASFSKFGLEVTSKHYCTLSGKWKYAMFLAYAPSWLLVIAFMCTLRNQQDPVLATEYMQTFEYLVVVLVITLLYGIAMLTGVNTSTLGRCFLTFSQCCLVFFHFWTRFGWPVYLCLFRPREEMDEFERELTAAGARALSIARGQRIHLPSSEGAILEAFREASEELDRYKDEIRKLEVQKLLLEGKIRELRACQAKM